MAASVHLHLSSLVPLLLATGTCAAVEQWGHHDLVLAGPSAGNPFTEVALTARFTLGGTTITVPGFYDGDGRYVVRFMPPASGEWRYTTVSNRPELADRNGVIEATPPSAGHHGPVQAAGVHLRYADGTPYHQYGTTCYAWIHQPDALQQQTLTTLASAPFNKIRYCIFPKSYAYNANDPPCYAFVRKEGGGFDHDRFDPVFWRRCEERTQDLQRLGIEADIILWHPYDRWGFSEMGREQDDRYLRYAIARLSALSNVWWSLANEFDLMKPGATKGHHGNKDTADWERFLGILAAEDPCGHLRSIHNCRGFFDYGHPAITHASIQSSDMNQGLAFRARWSKPVVYDECRYEGDLPQGWGRLTGAEMTWRFWHGTLQGCYVGHSEAFLHPQDLIWWSKGGELRGQSPLRIAWLKSFMADAPPFQDLTPQGDAKGFFLLAKAGAYYLAHSLHPESMTVAIAGTDPYRLDAIDPWLMTITSLGTVPAGDHVIPSPQRNLVYRFRR